MSRPQRVISFDREILLPLRYWATPEGPPQGNSIENDWNVDGSSVPLGMLPVSDLSEKHMPWADLMFSARITIYNITSPDKPCEYCGYSQTYLPSNSIGIAFFHQRSMRPKCYVVCRPCFYDPEVWRVCVSTTPTRQLIMWGAAMKTHNDTR